MYSVVWAGGGGACFANLPSQFVQAATLTHFEITVPPQIGLTRQAVLVTIVTTHTATPSVPNNNIAPFYPSWLGNAGASPVRFIDSGFEFGPVGATDFVTNLWTDTSALSFNPLNVGGFGIDVELGPGGTISYIFGGYAWLTGSPPSADVTVSVSALIIDDTLPPAMARPASFDFPYVTIGATDSGTGGSATAADTYITPSGQVWDVPNQPLVSALGTRGLASTTQTVSGWTVAAGSLHDQTSTTTASDVHTELATAPSPGPGLSQSISYTLGASEIWRIDGIIVRFWRRRGRAFVHLVGL